jgi:hypothetical protein
MRALGALLEFGVLAAEVGCIGKKHPRSIGGGGLGGGVIGAIFLSALGYVKEDISTELPDAPSLPTGWLLHCADGGVALHRCGLEPLVRHLAIVHDSWAEEHGHRGRIVDQAAAHCLVHNLARRLARRVVRALD